jgi:hypothetical protein
MQTEVAIEKRISRRVMLPETASQTREATDTEDARKTRWGVSPSYHINLGSLTGNRWTGYSEIFPRTLYKFEQVHPTGINESPDRLDEEKILPPFQNVSRSPRTCAEDVKATADDRVFVIFSSLVGREDALLIWDAIYPVEAEAEIWATTDRSIRGQVPDYLKAYYAEIGLEAPYVREGHALALFVEHLERNAPSLIAEAGFSDEVLLVAESVLAEILEAANEAFQHRSTRLYASFGSMETRKTEGKGKSKLDRHDMQCIAETGIQSDADKRLSVATAQGEALGEKISERSVQSEGKLAEAVSRLAEGQATTNRALAQMGNALAVLLEERAAKQ